MDISAFYLQTRINYLIVILGFFGVYSCNTKENRQSPNDQQFTKQQINPAPDTIADSILIPNMKDDTIIVNDTYVEVPLRKFQREDLLAMEQQGIISFRKLGHSYGIQSDSSITNAVWFFGEKRSEYFCSIGNRYILLILNVRDAKFSYLLILDRITQKHKIVLLQTFQQCSIYQSRRHFLVVLQHIRVLSGHQYENDYLIFSRKDVTQNAFCSFPVDRQPITLDQDAVYGSSGFAFKKDTVHLVAKIWDNRGNDCLATAVYHSHQFVLQEKKSSTDFYTYINSGQGLTLHDF